MLVGQGDGDPTGTPVVPETFAAIPDIESITPGDMTTGIIEKTHLRSPGRHREKLATLRDSGAIVLQGNYRPSHGAHKQNGGDGFLPDHSVLALWRAVKENNFKLVLPVEAGMVGTPPDDTAIELTIRGVISRIPAGRAGAGWQSAVHV